MEKSGGSGSGSGGGHQSASQQPATTRNNNNGGNNQVAHHSHPIRQSSIPIANALLSTVNATRQRLPMCVECEKSLPNQIVFDKIESIIRLMQDESNGLPVKTAKSFMSKIPSVFTGTDLVQWMMRNLRLDDQQEAIHLANLIASHGYIFPIEDHTLSIKNDCTFYRFQTPCLWPSNNIDPENTDYAVYLCKRTMQGKARLELADYEAENLARLQKMFSRKWEFIFMQAESQAKVDKKRDKLERKVLDSQERAFWDVYRPVPGCVNTTELDIKKACRLSKSAKRCSQCQKVTTNPAPASSPSASSSAATTATTAANQHHHSLNPSASNKQPPTPTLIQASVAPAESEQSVAKTKKQEQPVAEQLETGSTQTSNNQQSANNRTTPQLSPATAKPDSSSASGSSASPSFSLSAQQQQSQPQKLAANSQSSENSNPSSGSCRKLENDAEQDDRKSAKSSDRNELATLDEADPSKAAASDTTGRQQQDDEKQQQQTITTTVVMQNAEDPSVVAVVKNTTTTTTTTTTSNTQQQQQQQPEIPKDSKSTSQQAAHHHHHAHAHAHGHTHGHHHHHHHHHHPHSHHNAHHHHHHHHHHHKTCPHHQKQQQQQAKAQQLSTSSTELKSSQPQGCNNEQHHHHHHNRTTSTKTSMKQSKKHSSSGTSVESTTTGGARQTATIRRRSECVRINSISECPGGVSSSSAMALSGTTTTRDHQNKTDQAAAVDDEQQDQTTTVKTSKKRPPSSSAASEQQQPPSTSNCDQRPASACCETTTDPRKAQSSSMGARQTSAELEELKEKLTSTGSGGAQMVRKSSLNILRTPQTTCDQQSSSTLIASRKGSIHLGATAHHHHHNQQQRAQLKGTQSVCDNSLAAASSSTSIVATGAVSSDVGHGNSSQDLHFSVSSSLSLVDKQNITDLERELESLRVRLDRGGVKMSKVTQSYLNYFKQWAEYDPFIAQPIPSNPWQSDSTELWDSERQTKDVHCRRVRRWAFSLKELLSDPAGREQFHRFLEKEFSAENLKFWDAVQELKRVPSRDVARRVEAIWTEYLAQDANCPINIDSKSYETSKKNMAKNKNNRYIFDEAAGHVYQLMKNDSYPRYLRSDMYKDYKEASERRRPNQVAFDVFKPQITTLKHKFNF